MFMEICFVFIREILLIPLVISKKPYIFGKLLHGIIAAFYTFIALNIFPFLNFDL